MTKRNQSVDMLRGIAMLLVVLGHTLSGSTQNAENTIVYQIIWSIQMPMFILISGYINKYSAFVDKSSQLWCYIRKRTAGYIIPWIVWTVLIRGILCREYQYLNLTAIVRHMDSGYWFLFSIWTISMIHGIACYFATKFQKNKYVLYSTFYLIGMFFLAFVGMLWGMNFLCVKLSLYYMLFYYIGFIFGAYQEKIEARLSVTVREVIVAFCVAVWLGIISRVNLYDISDSINGIIVRFISSMTGCVALAGLLPKSIENALAQKWLNWIGRHTIEIYLIHYLFLNRIKMQFVPECVSFHGILLSVMCYVETILLSVLCIKIIEQNRVIKKLLFFR